MVLNENKNIEKRTLLSKLSTGQKKNNPKSDAKFNNIRLWS